VRVRRGGAGRPAPATAFVCRSFMGYAVTCRDLRALSVRKHDRARPR